MHRRRQRVADLQYLQLLVTGAQAPAQREGSFSLRRWPTTATRNLPSAGRGAWRGSPIGTRRAFFPVAFVKAPVLPPIAIPGSGLPFPAIPWLRAIPESRKGRFRSALQPAVCGEIASGRRHRRMAAAGVQGQQQFAGCAFHCCVTDTGGERRMKPAHAGRCGDCRCGSPRARV